MHIFIFRGVSGSGKSLWASKLRDYRLNRGKCTVVSADEYFMKDGRYEFDPSKLGEAHNWCFIQFMKAVLEGGDRDSVIVDNTNCNYWEMAPYVAFSHANGIDPVVNEIVPDKRDLHLYAERNSHGVPLKVIESQYEAIFKGIPIPLKIEREKSRALTVFLDC